MLGDQIAEETGKVTGFRVVDAAGPKVEVSIQTKGNILERNGKAARLTHPKYSPVDLSSEKARAYTCPGMAWRYGTAREREGSIRAEA